MIAEVEAFLAEVAGAAPGSLSLVVRHGGDGPRDTALVFALDARGELTAVVKVATRDEARARLRDEAARLRQLRETLPAALSSTVPRAIGHVEREGIALLAEAPLAGRRLKDLPRGPRADAVLLEHVVDWLLAFAAGTPQALAMPGSAAWREHVQEPVASYLNDFAVSPAEGAALRAIPDELAAACSGCVPLVRIHGDFCDANLLVRGDSLCVIDWDEPVTTGPPGLDLVYLLASRLHSRVGPGDVEAGAHLFADAFFSRSQAAHRNAVLLQRYLGSLGLRRAAALPLFVLSWVRLALQKFDYLEAGTVTRAVGSGRAVLLERPELHYPVTLIRDGACLNVSIALALRDDFCVQAES